MNNHYKFPRDTHKLNQLFIIEKQILKISDILIHSIIKFGMADSIIMYLGQKFVWFWGTIKSLLIELTKQNWSAKYIF